MCYLCFIYIFLLDPECFKIKPKVDTASDILAPLTQSNDSSNKTSSDATLYINTTANTTSELQHGIINGNKIGHGTDPTSVNTNQTTHPQSFLYQDWSGFIPHYDLNVFLRKCTCKIELFGMLSYSKIFIFSKFLE